MHGGIMGEGERKSTPGRDAEGADGDSNQEMFAGKSSFPSAGG
jgi:hypothetical protein